MLKEMDVRIERLTAMRAVYAYAPRGKPEDFAVKKVVDWAKKKSLLGKGDVRFFARNTYANDKIEEPGYECFLTIEGENTFKDIETNEIPGGLYAVLRFKDLRNISFAWKKLWSWIEDNGYQPAGWLKTPHGWVGGFEERINWQDNAPPTQGVFDLWVPLEE
jgi:effector-binding domain-containing protein